MAGSEPIRKFPGNFVMGNALMLLKRVYWDISRKRPHSFQNQPVSQPIEKM